MMATTTQKKGWKWKYGQTHRKIGWAPQAEEPEDFSIAMLRPVDRAVATVGVDPQPPLPSRVGSFGVPGVTMLFISAYHILFSHG